MPWLIPARRMWISDREYVDTCMINTFQARLEQPFTPLYFGHPCDTSPRAARNGRLDQEVAPNVVSVRDNHVVLDEVLKRRLDQKVEIQSSNAERTFSFDTLNRRMNQRAKTYTCLDAPKEPCTGIDLSSILFPSAEMISP